MKIYDETGKQVGEIEKPEPIEQDGVWYEAVEYRLSKNEENFFSTEAKFLFKSGFDFKYELRWIASPIPRPTAEQLAAIGMVERDRKPVECKKNDFLWCNEVCIEHTNDGRCGGCPRMIGRPRFVLVAKEKPISRCASCLHYHGDDAHYDPKLDNCIHQVGVCRNFDKWTPKPAPALSVENLLNIIKRAQAELVSGNTRDDNNYFAAVKILDEVLIERHCSNCGNTQCSYSFECRDVSQELYPHADPCAQWQPAQPEAPTFTVEVVKEKSVASVAGRRMQMSHVDFERACAVLIAEEQNNPAPNNALIGLLANAIMLSREYCDLASPVCPSAPAPTFSVEQVVDLVERWLIDRLGTYTSSFINSIIRDPQMGLAAFTTPEYPVAADSDWRAHLREVGELEKRNGVCEGYAKTVAAGNEQLRKQNTALTERVKDLKERLDDLLGAWKRDR